MGKSMHLVTSFDAWISWALGDLALMPARDAPYSQHTRRTMLEMAAVSVRHALRRANEMGCPVRKALCLRVLNWLRADLRKLAS